MSIGGTMLKYLQGSDTNQRDQNYPGSTKFEQVLEVDRELLTIWAHMVEKTFCANFQANTYQMDCRFQSQKDDLQYNLHSWEKIQQQN